MGIRRVRVPSTLGLKHGENAMPSPQKHFEVLCIFGSIIYRLNIWFTCKNVAFAASKRSIVNTFHRDIRTSINFLCRMMLTTLSHSVT